MIFDLHFELVLLKLVFLELEMLDTEIYDIDFDQNMIRHLGNTFHNQLNPLHIEPKF